MAFHAAVNWTRNVAFIAHRFPSFYCMQTCRTLVESTRRASEGPRRGVKTGEMWAAVSGEFLQTATDCPFFLYLEGHWAVWRPCETRCTHFVLPDVNGAASQGNWLLQGIAGQLVPEARIRLDNGGELVWEMTMACAMGGTSSASDPRATQ